MIEILEIYEFELRQYVEAAYEGDADLLTKYHVDDFTFDEAVGMTIDMIEMTSEGIEMKNYGVFTEGEPIGYLTCFCNNLYSFGININHRKSEVLSEFWESIKAILGNSFICMLYPNNTRAISWLQKCEMQIVEGVEDNCVTLLYHHNLN